MRDEAETAAGRSEPVAGMRAVTISRQYGSGGGEVAARLARRLGWPLVDHEIIVGVAGALGETEAQAEALDEHPAGFLARMLGSMVYVPSWEGCQPPLTAEEAQRRYQTALHQVIRAAVAAGPAVIVGRGAQAILAGRRDVLHARIVAPPALRVAYVERREGLAPAAARARVQHKDRDRTRYLESVEHVRPDDPLLYDLTLNTGVLTLDDAVDLIALALARKADRLAAPASGLGPGSGLAPYPGPPGATLTPPSPRARAAGAGGGEL